MLIEISLEIPIGTFPINSYKKKKKAGINAYCYWKVAISIGSDVSFDVNFKIVAMQS